MLTTSNDLFKPRLNRDALSQFGTQKNKSPLASCRCERVFWFLPYVGNDLSPVRADRHLRLCCCGGRWSPWLLVQPQPVPVQREADFHESLEIQRLYQIRICSELVGAIDVAGGVRRTKHHYAK